MAKNLNNVRIYGDTASGVYVAPKGTPGPTDLKTPPAAYAETGWTEESGVEVDRKEDSKQFHAWQGGTLIRSKTSSVEDTLKFTALEETAAVMGLYYKGVTPTTATGVDTFVITNQTRSDERAWVFDFVDGGITKRYVIPSGVVTGGKINHSNSDTTSYEFTVTIQGDYTILKSSPTA